MTRVLDTSDVTVGERSLAVRNALRAVTTAPVEVAPGFPYERSRVRIDAWRFGAISLGLVEGHGLQLTGHAARPRPQAVKGITLRLHVPLCTDGPPASDAFEWDLREPYDFTVSGSAVILLHLRFEDFGLQASHVQPFARLGTKLPIAALVESHLLGLVRDADGLSRAASAALVADATVTLVRALITTSPMPRTEVSVREALLTSILEYVQAHIKNPDLTAEMVARANNISVRYFYQLWAARSVPFAEWVMTQRLDGARRELATGEALLVPIAEIARRWSFKDPTHFSRRFRAAFGMSPRQWRASEHVLRERFDLQTVNGRCGR